MNNSDHSDSESNYSDESDMIIDEKHLYSDDDKITPDEREIQKIKWMDADKLKEEIIKNPDKYVPPFIKGMKKYFIEFYKTKK